MFRQTPGGRGLLLLSYFRLKSHENGIFGCYEAGMALHSSPKEMGLQDGSGDYPWTVHDLTWDCFTQSGIGFWTEIVHV